MFFSLSLFFATESLQPQSFSSYDIEKLAITELFELSFSKESAYTDSSGREGLLHWKQQLDRNVDTRKLEANICSIHLVLNRIGIFCTDLETLCIKDKALNYVLTLQSKSPNLSSQVKVSDMDSTCCIAFKMKTRVLRKSLKDVVTENELQKRILVDVIPPSDVGVAFIDIGALENVKETLKELVMLPLRRPEIFSKGWQMDLIYYANKALISTVY
ncbi:uncharacterized protein LOC111314128 isoform X3 [Olea europaea subsp. europaea]|uniref:Uncharacterized protein LOC111314128 isoform X3 n=1 Tax=Olea europaea subsp. europaea TaxID=158383 RepID=A0A8S0TUT8_OLEEU|nr:uncharacterized protein LOC111314128 isoform X3 [Olea europaea subsp. europaea]